MEIKELIMQLSILENLGFKEVSFYVDDEIPPTSGCSFEVSSYDGELVLCNYVKRVGY